MKANTPVGFPRLWFVVFALFAALATVLAVNVYHYASAVFGLLP